MARGRVLVVEDDAHLRELMRDVFVQAGLEVLEAEDGSAALLRLHERPDVILLDLHMPILDGYAFLQTYRGMPKPRPPVVCMTAFPLPPALPIDDVVEVIEKPFAVNELLAVIDRALRRWR